MTSDVDRYFAALDDPKRSTMEEMRRRILVVIPDAEQCLSYAVPGFKVQGKTVAGLAAFTNHLSYLPHSGSVLAQLGDKVTSYAQTKSALHFAVDDPLPQDLVASLVTAKLRESGIG
jgi:uncharacterized protein YdhG (YjbR/CyaY superfamily)